MPKVTEQVVVTQNLSIYPEDRAVLHQVAEDYGLASVSAAARFIIRDWVKMKQAGEDGPVVRAWLAGLISAKEAMERIASYHTN